MVVDILGGDLSGMFGKDLEDCWKDVWEIAGEIRLDLGVKHRTTTEISIKNL